MGLQQLAQHIREGAKLFPQIYSGDYFQWRGQCFETSLTGACALGGCYISLFGEEEVPDLGNPNEVVEDEEMQERLLDAVNRKAHLDLRIMIPFKHLPSHFVEYNQSLLPLIRRSHERDGCLSTNVPPAFALWWAIVLLNDTARWSSERIADWIETLPSELFT